MTPDHTAATTYDVDIFAAVTQASEALEDILDIALLEEAAKEDDGARIPLSAAKLE